MPWKTVLTLALVASHANALIRFACSQLVIERFDPLVSPGKLSGHLHQIVGGNAFNVTMDPANDIPSLSTCTTCTFNEDFSNYWTAVLYFQHANGTFKRVPQMPGQFLGNPNGGMTIYYIQPDDRKVTAFAPGFRMLVGDASARSLTSYSSDSFALSFRCLDANYGNSGVDAAPGTQTRDLPAQPCAGGIRSQILFPTCWDGVNVDSADHKSHVAYGYNGCPSTHPVELPQIFIETVWDTREFDGMWPDSGKQPFVWSMGDPVGVGQHADYVFGWKGDALQRAMDTCTDSNGFGCTELTTQSVSAINKCTQAPRVDEQVDGWLESLPGCNPIQPGPSKATAVSDCGAPTTYLSPGVQATPSTTSTAIRTTATPAPPVKTTTTQAPPVPTTSTYVPPIRTTASSSSVPPVRTSTTQAPPVPTTSSAPPIRTTATQAPSPSTSTSIPPVKTTTTQAPPAPTTTYVPPIRTTVTSSSVAPPVRTSTSQAPPVPTSSTAPPIRTTATQAPPPSTTTSTYILPVPTSSSAPTIRTTTTQAPPVPSSSSVRTTTSSSAPPIRTTTVSSASPVPTTTTSSAAPPVRTTTTSAAPPVRTTTSSTAPPVKTTTTTTTKAASTSTPPSFSWPWFPWPQPTQPGGIGIIIVPKYGQCGGKFYTGPSTCRDGTACTAMDEWYSHCL